MSNSDFAIFILGIIILIDSVILIKHEWKRSDQMKKFNKGVRK